MEEEEKKEDKELAENKQQAQLPNEEEHNADKEEVAQNGIFPEDMDFRKFIGCGG